MDRVIQGMFLPGDDSSKGHNIQGINDTREHTDISPFKANLYMRDVCVICPTTDKVLEGPLTLKQLELSLRDLNTEWFLGSKSDVRSADLAKRVFVISR